MFNVSMGPVPEAPGELSERGTMVVSKGARGPYARTARSRREILDAAFALFATNGYRGVTLKDVAARVRMTPSGLSYHFKTKEELLTAVLQEREAHYRSPVRPHMDPDFSDIVESTLSMLAANLENVSFAELHCVLSAEATASDHPAHDYFRERYARLRSDLEAHFEHLRESRQLEFHQGLTSDVLAVLLLAVLDGTQLQWLLESGKLDIVRIVHQFLRSVLAPSLSRSEEI